MVPTNAQVRHKRGRGNGNEEPKKPEPQPELCILSGVSPNFEIFGFGGLDWTGSAFWANEDDMQLF